MAKLTRPEDRVTKAHIRIMTSPEFCMFSGVLSIGDITFTKDIPTACTNGRDVIYNPDFIDTMNDKELTFLILHEAIHKAFQHMHLWQRLFKEDARLANMAADYVVNSSILEADPMNKRCEMPKDALYDPKYNGMTTKQIFELLKKNPPPSPMRSQGSSVNLPVHKSQMVHKINKKLWTHMTGKALRKCQRKKRKGHKNR